MSVEGGTQQARITGGPQAVTQRLADELGKRVVLGDAVWRIARHGRCGGRQHARDLRRSSAHHRHGAPAREPDEVDPPLPALRDGLAHRMPHGSVIKVQGVYREPFWRADALSGTGLLARARELHRRWLARRWSARRAVGFIESRQARALADAPAERVRAAALDGLAAFVGERHGRRTRLRHGLVGRSWTRGCYSGHVAPGAWTSFGPALREPCGPKSLGGDQTAVRMCGYIDGAVESGRRAAAEVLAALGPPPRISR